MINGDFHRSKRISSNFDKEISLIKDTLMNADDPVSFINSVNEFKRVKNVEMKVL